MCAICERTLLLGERAVRFAPDEGAELVEVCPLCQEIAVEHGWLKEGTPTTPTISGDKRPQFQCSQHDRIDQGACPFTDRHHLGRVHESLRRGDAFEQLGVAHDLKRRRSR